MNSCQFVGRFLGDPELTTYTKSSGETAFVTNFVLEISRIFRKKNGEVREQVYHFDFEAWDIGAKLITDSFGKGDWITIHASAKTDKYKDGVKFRVNEFEIPKWTSNDNAKHAQPEPARV